MRKFNLPKYHRYAYGIELRTSKFSSHALICILLSGDIATNPGPNTVPSTGLIVLYVNARSIKPFVPLDGNPSRKVCKMSILQELVHSNDYDRCCLYMWNMGERLLRAFIEKIDLAELHGGGVLIHENPC